MARRRGAGEGSNRGGEVSARVRSGSPRQRLATVIWNLEPIDRLMRDQALEAIGHRDIVGFLGTERNEKGLELVACNLHPLLANGLLEQAFVEAWIGTRTNWVTFPLRTIRRILRHCGRGRLRAAGDRIPPGDSFTLYRGVAGLGAMRRESGLSWTRSAERAGWFASQFEGVLERPAVLMTKVSRDDVLFYSNGYKDDFALFATRWRQLQT